VLTFMEGELGRSTWFAGEALSGADVMLSFPIEAAAVRTNLASDYPRLNAFLERVHGRPAYRKALERGGPYQLLAS
jgi:glutathione S-transferase